MCKLAQSLVLSWSLGKISVLPNKITFFFFLVTWTSSGCVVWVGYVFCPCSGEFQPGLYSTLHSVGNHLTFSSFLWFTFNLMENNSTENKFILLQLSKKFHFQEISKMSYTEIKSGSCIFAFLVFVFFFPSIYLLI